MQPRIIILAVPMFLIVARSALAKGTADSKDSMSGGDTSGVLEGDSASETSEGVATVPPKSPQEKRAAKLGRSAIADYWAGDYDSAEEKLKRAITDCDRQGCSLPFVARLHRDLGVVYVAGMKRTEAGEAEFATALTADATVILTAPMDTKEVHEVFAAAKREVEGESAAEGQDTSEVQAPASARDSDAAGKAPAGQASKSRDNWVSLGIEQNLLFHSSTNNACNAGSRYDCFDASGNYRDLTAEPIVGGNDVASSGFLPATLRILAGYDRAFASRFTVGGRLGLALNSKSPRAPGVPAFLALHLEARGAIWLGANPFNGQTWRPYVFLSAGLAEIDGKVSVDVYYQGDPEKYQVPAWKRSGQAFVGTGVGLQALLWDHHGPLLELRYMQMFPAVSPALGVQAGYVFGF